MSRLVEHDRKEPYKVEPGGETIWVCGCGLSRKKPFCDGSHKRTTDEQPGAVYVYDGQGRIQVPME